MRKELVGTYVAQENGNLLVSARNKDLEILQFAVDKEELLLRVNGREIELRPVVGKVTLISSTPEMERVMAAGGKGCYSNRPAAEIFPKLTKEEAQDFIRNQIIPTGHFSVLEHGYFTFGIEGVSRALTHQLVRHRLASYSQQSQRYTNPVAEQIEKPVFKFIVPPSIRYSEERFLNYTRVVKEELRAYVDALNDGVKEEDARMFLPNAAGTNITMSLNARALYEVATKRSCALAQWEIDMILTQMVLIAAKKALSVFETAGPECARTKCREGKRSCKTPIQPLITYINEQNFPHDKLIFGMK